MRSLCCLLLLLFLSSLAHGGASLAHGGGSNWVKRVLAHQKMHNHEARGRDFAKKALKYIRSTRFARNSRGDYVIAREEGVLSNGRYFEISLGEDVKARMRANGDWLAVGKSSAVYNGGIHEDPQRVADFHRHLFSPVLRERAPGNSKLPRGKDGSAKAPNPSAKRVSVVVDRSPPRVESIKIITQPNDPQKQRVHRGSRVFVGAFLSHIEIRMSEKMETSPSLRIKQQGRAAMPLALLEDRNPIFTYQFFPDTSPDANGPAGMEIEGQDLAGNPIDQSSVTEAGKSLFLVDTIAPDLRRVDTSLPGNFQSIPKADATIAGDDFPSKVSVFVADYSQEDDGSFNGANLDSSNASGIDWDALRLNDGSLALRLIDPRGREIPGTITARVPALELLLPDVFDPSLGIFPDSDSDGSADPIEGSYRMEVSLVDKVGNSSRHTLPWGMDTTAIDSNEIDVSIRPVFTEPKLNPENPIAPKGVAIKRLDSIEITSPDSDFSFTRSNAKLLFYSQGLHFRPKEIKTKLSRGAGSMSLKVLDDQDGDGEKDFENPEAGQYLPPGMVDPRWGKNDGLYVVEIDAVDKAGNSSKQSRNITLDTTPPEVAETFPKEELTIGPPLRMVDAIVKDPRASSQAKGSGIALEDSFIRLVFEGNEQVPAQDVKGLAFIHEVNNDDPTQPDYNPNDKYPKLLYELVDEEGQVSKLPDDGSWDGRYRLEVVAYDQEGNQVGAVTSFSYSSTTTSTTTTPMEIYF